MSTYMSSLYTYHCTGCNIAMAIPEQTARQIKQQKRSLFCTDTCLERYKKLFEKAMQEKEKLNAISLSKQLDECVHPVPYSADSWSDDEPTSDFWKFLFHPKKPALPPIPKQDKKDDTYGKS
jgi:hypothetical protein